MIKKSMYILSGIVLMTSLTGFISYKNTLLQMPKQKALILVCKTQVFAGFGNPFLVEYGYYDCLTNPKKVEERMKPLMLNPDESKNFCRGFFNMMVDRSKELGAPFTKSDLTHRALTYIGGRDTLAHFANQDCRTDKEEKKYKELHPLNKIPSFN